MKNNYKKRKNPFRSPAGERPILVRILAIVIVVILAVTMVISLLPAFVFAEEKPLMPGDRGPLLIDDADLLTDAEEAELKAGLDAFRKEQDFDIVVLTVESLNGMGVVEYADRFYDDNAYGGGEEFDGALIIVSTEYRDWTMITSGYGITAITDYSLDNMEEEILPDLSKGNYLKAFETFADSCAYCVREARDGNIIDEWIEEPADSESQGSQSGAAATEREYPLAMNLGSAGIIGVLVSWFSNSRKKAQMKTVRYRTQAKEYVRKGSLQLTENRDRFLYRSVNRVPINIDKDDNKPKGHFRGSKIHLSPGGRIHGGGRPSKF